MINGHRKSFHVHMNVITPSVASAGAESGRTIRVRTPSRDAPSMRAASSSSTGSVRKNCRIMKMPKPVARLGRIRAGSVSIRPADLTIRNVGIITTWNGIISVARIRKNAMFLPAKRSRANA